MDWLPPIPRSGLYAGVNAAFIVCVLVLAAIGGFVNPRVMYLIVLFAICSTPIIDIDRLNGALFMPSFYLAFYFVSFGVLALTRLPQGISSESLPSLISATEAAIIAGVLMVVAGYRAAIALASSKRATSAGRDWPMPTILLVGVAIW